MEIRCNGNIKHIKYPVIVDIKYDGEFAHYADGKLTNKNGKEWPVDLGPYEFIGELCYCSGQAATLYDWLSVRNADNWRRFASFYVFDILRHPDHDVSRMPLFRRRHLLSGIAHTLCAKSVTGRVVETPKALREIFTRAVNGGYEGIMVKSYKGIFNENTGWIKLKNRVTNDLQVLSIDPTEERISVATTLGKDCGVRVRYRDKQTLCIGDIVEIQHQGILSGGGLRHPVFIRKRNDKKTADNLGEEE